MILIDSSIWIDWLSTRDTPGTKKLDALLDTPITLFICDRILQEVLQGVRDDARAREINRQLAIFECLDTGGVELARASAELYRGLRKKGVTVRGTIDVLIATLCIENRLSLLHNDRDFDVIAKHAALRVEKV
jgi:predicted nucleic acid-binding protein